jgi:hypothetical protein
MLGSGRAPRQPVTIPSFHQPERLNLRRIPLRPWACQPGQSLALRAGRPEPSPAGPEPGPAASWKTSWEQTRLTARRLSPYAPLSLAPIRLSRVRSGQARVDRPRYAPAGAPIQAHAAESMRTDGGTNATTERPCSRE